MKDIHSFVPIFDPTLKERLRKSVAQLEVPSEALLLLIFRDVQHQLEQHRRSLLQMRDEAKEDGLTATASIILKPEDLHKAPDGDYIGRSMQQERRPQDER